VTAGACRPQGGSVQAPNAVEDAPELAPAELLDDSFRVGDVSLGKLLKIPDIGTTQEKNGYLQYMNSSERR
jgi:hypothetical protein